MLRRKTRLMEGEARDEGASAELSDMRRRGSLDAQRDTSQGEEVYSPTKHCGAYRREDDGSGRIAAKTTGAAAQGAGERPRPRAPRRTPEGAKRGLLRRRQRSGTRENETSRAGLRPEGVYVYAERSQGRANRPFLAGEHRCGEASRTLTGRPAAQKAIQPYGATRKSLCYQTRSSAAKTGPSMQQRELPRTVFWMQA